ncbi:fimbrial protein [Salmonella enterica]|nr:fimbrial protein [Salmonella enterica]ELK2044397.1 fimbrial protein [Salmonella enterica]
MTIKFRMLCLLLSTLSLFSQASYGWSVFVGDYGNVNSSNISSSISDITVDFNPTTFVKPLAMHEGNGLREIAVTDAARDLDPHTGLSCNKDGNEGQADLHHGYIDSGLTYNGNKLWKTNITGLYFALEFTSINFGGKYYSEQFWVNWASGDSAAKSFNMHTIMGADQRTKAGMCDRATNWKYYAYGGIVLWIKYHIYIDDKFNPNGATSLPITFLKSSIYDLKFNTPYTSDAAQHSVSYVFNSGTLNINYPTCTASAVTGEGVSNATVPFGRVSAEDIVNGSTTMQKTFSIELSNCKYVKNLNVTLDSTNIGTTDKTLLSNTLTSSAASGIGVMIEGEKNPLSTSDWTLLKPRDSTSVYKFTNTPDYTNSDIGNSTQTMNFRATLKQDGSNVINAGEFKATGRFTINYP